MKEEKNIDDLFRSSFEDFEVAPPAAVKEAIDRQIGGRPSRRKFWWFFLLVLLGGTGAFAYVYTTSASEKTPLAHSTGASGITTTSSVRSGRSSGSAVAGPSASGSTAASENSSAAKTTASQQRIAGSSGVSTTAQRSAGASKTAKGQKTATTSGKTTAGKKTTSKKAGSGGKGGNNSAGKQNGTAPGNSAGSSAAGNASSGGNGPVGPNDGKSPDATTNSGDQQTPPADSIPEKENQPVAEADHSDDSSFDPVPKKPGNTDPPADLWRASVYLGPQFALNNTSIPKQTLAENPASFQVSGEISRSLFAGYGLSSGILYNTKRTETFKWDTYVYGDSTLTSEWEYIYGNPNFPDSITDSVLVDVWVYDSTALTGTQVNSISMFGVPLYVTKHFAFGDNWGLLVNVGAQFNFYSVKLGSSDSVPVKQTVNDFSVALLGRAHVTYKWNQWQFSAGLNGGYDLKLPIIYEGIDRRRYFITPQIGIHFIF